MSIHITVTQPDALPGTPNLTLPTRAAEAMTKRRTQILQLAAQGNTTAQIATELKLSPNTVHNNLTAVYTALGARDRAHATSLGIRYGLIDLTRIHSDHEAGPDVRSTR